MSRLSYANVAATLALFIALGGTGYAAAVLPRGSVGTAAIRDGAIRSRDIRDGTLRPRDLAAPARPGPRDQRGRRSYRAVVQSDGVLLRGTASSARHDGPGAYTVHFPVVVDRWTAAATIATNDSAGSLPGAVTVDMLSSLWSSTIAIRTFDSRGEPSDRPFHLLVAC